MPTGSPICSPVGPPRRTIAFSGLAIAACAAYDKQAHAAGTFGLVALCAAIVGTVNLGANMWFEGFAVPWLADVVLQVLTAQKTMFWKALQLHPLLHRLGARTCIPRAGVFPRLISPAIVAEESSAFCGIDHAYGVALGLALLSLGSG